MKKRPLIWIKVNRSVWEGFDEGKGRSHDVNIISKDKKKIKKTKIYMTRQCLIKLNPKKIFDCVVYANARQCQNWPNRRQRVKQLVDGQQTKQLHHNRYVKDSWKAYLPYHGISTVNPHTGKFTSYFNHSKFWILSDSQRDSVRRAWLKLQDPPWQAVPKLTVSWAFFH